MKTTVKILTQDELKQRYSGKMKDTRMAKLTWQAVEKGYSIALVEQDNLHSSVNLIKEVLAVLEDAVPTTSIIMFCAFTDMSELDNNDKLYCAFKEIKENAYTN